jgi:ascorbate-specific PTS system EIIC-type component UlaA
MLSSIIMCSNIVLISLERMETWVVIYMVTHTLPSHKEGLFKSSLALTGIEPRTGVTIASIEHGSGAENMGRGEKA